MLRICIRRVVPYDMINIILQLGAAHFEFLNFLIGREIDVLFDAIHFVVQTVIFIEQAPEMVVGAFQAPNNFAMFRELSQDRMMKVHGDNNFLCRSLVLEACKRMTGRRVRLGNGRAVLW